MFYKIGGKNIFFGSFCHFSKLWNKNSKKTNRICSSTTVKLPFCVYRLFLAATVFSNGVLTFWRKKLPFFGVFCYFSVLLNKKFEKTDIPCYSTTHQLHFCANRLFLAATVFSHDALEKYLQIRTRYKKKKNKKINKSGITILYHMYKAHSGFSAAARRKSRRGASRRSSSFANQTGFENILNIWCGPGPGGFGRTHPRCFHGRGRSLCPHKHRSSLAHLDYWILIPCRNCPWHVRAFWLLFS